MRRTNLLVDTLEGLMKVGRRKKVFICRWVYGKGFT